MNDPLDEEIIREMLHSVESSAHPSPEAKARARRRTLATFDHAVETGSTDTTRGVEPRGDPPSSPAPLFDITPDDGRRPWSHRAVALAAAMAAVLGLSALVLRDQSDHRTVAEEGEHLAPAAVEVDASDVLPSLAVDINPDLATIKRSEPGVLVIELAEQVSPAREATDLTVIVVDEWGEALLAASVPRVEHPDSLMEWLAISGLDISTYGPFTVPDAVSSEFWWVTVEPGAANCVKDQPCGEIARSPGGETISLIAGQTNELTSIELPGGRTLLAHIAYTGQRDNPEPVGAEILRSLRLQ